MNIDTDLSSHEEWNEYSSRRVSEGYAAFINREITRERLRTVLDDLRSDKEFSGISFAQMHSAMQSLDHQIDQLSDQTESDRHDIFWQASRTILSWIASIIIFIKIGIYSWSNGKGAWQAESATSWSSRPLRLIEQFVAAASNAEFLLTMIGVLSLLFVTIRSTRATKRAWHDYGRQLSELAAPSLRSFVNQQADRDEPTKRQVSEAPALAHQEQLDRLVHRPESDRIHKLITKLGASSIAISGHRGVGKTTLMRNMASRSNAAGNWVNVHVTAPVGYDARDFLIHLYARLCEAVLENLEPSRRQSKKGTLALRLYARFAVRAASGTLVVIILLQPAAHFLSSNIQLARDEISAVEQFTTFVLRSVGFESGPRGGALILILIGLTAVYTAAGRFKYTINGYYPRPLARRTEDQLRRLKFIQTTSTNWAGGVKRGPFDLSRSRSRQLAELPLSLRSRASSSNTARD